MNRFGKIIVGWSPSFMNQSQDSGHAAAVWLMLVSVNCSGFSLKYAVHKV